MNLIERDRRLPIAPLFQYVDYFGNRVAHVGLLKEHRSLQIVSTAIVSTGPGRCEASPLDDIRCLDLLGESSSVHFDDVLRQFAGMQTVQTDPVEIASAICRKIRETFTYEPGATDVHSISSEVIDMRRGVCQDFAHVLIAACRAREVPARYVSGYLFDADRSPGVGGASHGWCEIYAGPETGWVGFDPTHDHIADDERYVKIGVGRDYADVAPVRGAYKGAAEESMNVDVDVTRA